MQGKKDYSEKLFTQFQLSEHVPKENFYRRLKAALDLSFLRKLTEGYYGNCGQKSIDPVVFMKLMLVGYLENLYPVGWKSNGVNQRSQTDAALRYAS